LEGGEIFAFAAKGRSKDEVPAVLREVGQHRDGHVRPDAVADEDRGRVASTRHSFLRSSFERVFVGGADSGGSAGPSKRRRDDLRCRNCFDEAFVLLDLRHRAAPC